MKIIQWNCNMAFRKKHKSILASNPDIVVICECEHPDKLKFGTLTPTPFDYFWHGNNENKGIGIFSYSNFKLEIVDDFKPDFKYVIPLKVIGENETFYLFAVWAMDNKEKTLERYIAQVWLAINHYVEMLNSDCILVGDFNSNQIWDKEKRLVSHSHVVSFLEERNIKSLYHYYFSETQGTETQSTFYLHRNPQKPYHLDYCFASERFWTMNFDIKIGNFEEWIKLSDHLPLEIEFN